MAGFVNKGFLFASSSRKIKSRVVENQITSLVWPSLVYHLQKNNAQLITCSFLMIESVSFTSGAFEIRLGSWQLPMLLPRHLPRYIYVFSICFAKKNAEAIKFLGMLKSTSPRIKYIFV